MKYEKPELTFVNFESEMITGPDGISNPDAGTNIDPEPE